jgi:preprotein translocase subunit SecE
MGEMEVALKKFLKERMTEFIHKIRAEVNIDNSPQGMKKIMEKLISFIDVTIRESKQ